MAFMSKRIATAGTTGAVELKRAGELAVPDDEVRRQLRRILAHARFLQAPRAAELLRYVVEETLAGRSAELKQYTLAVRGLGLSPRFDPQDSALVRIHMRHLRQLLVQYYADPGQLDPVCIDLVKGSYIPSFRWHEIPVAAALTVIDLPAAGTDAGLAAVASKFGATAPTVAVLDFANRGLSGDWYYFPSALAEALVIKLSQDGATAIMGPFNRSLFELEVGALHEVGLRYGATFVLDGSAQLSDGMLKVGVRLLASATGLQVWGHSYEYAAQGAQLLAIEEAIADHVCQALGHEFGAINRYLLERAVSPLAELTPYELMLRALHFFDHFTAGALLDSIAAAEYAVQQEPNFAVAWGGLGGLLAFAYGWPMSERAPFPRRARECVARALSLDPEDAWSQFSAGLSRALAATRKGSGCCAVSASGLVRLSSRGWLPQWTSWPASRSRPRWRRSRRCRRRRPTIHAICTTPPAWLTWRGETTRARWRSWMRWAPTATSRPRSWRLPWRPAPAHTRRPSARRSESSSSIRRSPRTVLPCWRDTITPATWRPSTNGWRPWRSAGTGEVWPGAAAPAHTGAGGALSPRS